MHGIVSGLYQWRHVRKSTKFQRKLDNLEVFNNDESLKATTNIYCQANIKFCMYVVDICHQECLVSIVIVWPTCTL